MRSSANKNFLKYLIIATGIVLLGIGAHFIPLISQPLKTLGNILIPIERSLYRLKVASGQFWFYLTQDIDGEVIALKSENERLKTTLAEISLLAKENDLLRSQLSIQKKHERSLALAHIIGEKPGSFSRFLVLDIGTNQGLRPGLPVVVNNALVGKIEKVSEHSAEMSLLTDPNSVFYSYLQSTKTKGLIKGTIGLGILHLTQIPKNATITRGDNVFTTGQELENFNDILIGSVTEDISSDQDTYLTLLVRPNVDTQNLDSVFVVLN
ncbi:MAG: rod shape-determining protein MreC [Candidatus Abawacabacteria bacterium]|nr:rod shape-determining protein MreC [Candidatus Abawacabacteria bacterium]